MIMMYDQGHSKAYLWTGVPGICRFLSGGAPPPQTPPFFRLRRYDSHGTKISFEHFASKPKKNRSAIFFGAHYFFLAAATQAYITRHGPSSDPGMSNKPVGQTPQKIVPRNCLAGTVFFCVAGRPARTKTKNQNFEKIENFEMFETIVFF